MEGTGYGGGTRGYWAKQTELATASTSASTECCLIALALPWHFV